MGPPITERLGEDLSLPSTNVASAHNCSLLVNKMAHDESRALGHPTQILIGADLNVADGSVHLLLLPGQESTDAAMRPGDYMRKNELAADTLDGFSTRFHGGFDRRNVTLHHNRYVASADVHPCANPRSPVELSRNAE